MPVPFKAYLLQNADAIGTFAKFHLQGKSSVSCSTSSISAKIRKQTGVSYQHKHFNPDSVEEVEVSHQSIGFPRPHTHTTFFFHFVNFFNYLLLFLLTATASTKTTQQTTSTLLHLTVINCLTCASRILKQERSEKGRVLERDKLDHSNVLRITKIVLQ